MNVQSNLVRKLFVAKATDPFLVRRKMSSHMLVVRVLRHINRAKTAAEYFWIIAELIITFVRFVGFQTIK